MDSKGKELAGLVMQNINYMGAEREFMPDFVEKISNDHPTLQQGFGRLTLKIIYMFAEKYEKKYYDARNEQICKICFRIKEMIEADFDGPFLPFI